MLWLAGCLYCRSDTSVRVDFSGRIPVQLAFPAQIKIIQCAVFQDFNHLIFEPVVALHFHKDKFKKMTYLLCVREQEESPCVPWVFFLFYNPVDQVSVQNHSSAEVYFTFISLSFLQRFLQTLQPLSPTSLHPICYLKFIVFMCFWANCSIRPFVCLCWTVTSRILGLTKHQNLIQCCVYSVIQYVLFPDQ